MYTKHMKLYISHSGSGDYEQQLYEPLKQSTALAKHDVFYPHDPENIAINTKEALKHFDYVLAEVSQPSTGQGIEIGPAEVYGVPVICFYKKGAQPSGSLKFVTKELFEYESLADFVQKVEVWLSQRR